MGVVTLCLDRMQRSQASRLRPLAITVNVWSELEDYWQVRTVGLHLLEIVTVCSKHQSNLWVIMTPRATIASKATV
jgi:hypothetical protein